MIGFVEVCIMHPLDLVKTRLQIQSGKALSKTDPKYYNGVFDCFCKMYKYEGITSYWKGIIPPILAETPKRAVKVSSLTTVYELISTYTYVCFSFLLLNSTNNSLCSVHLQLHHW